VDVVRQQLGSLFEQTIQLTAPLFQRPYVWRRNQNWEPLWETIASAASRRRDARTPASHFLGAIVLEQEVTTTLGLGNVRRIIDGQQRLTTFQVLLAALRNIATKNNLDFDADTVKRLTTNHTQEAKDRPKVVPTTADRDVFAAVMAARSATEVRGMKQDTDEPLPRLAEAYLFFHDAIEEWLGDSPNGNVQQLTKTIQNDLEVVVIGLDGKTDDAQEIFETLNARGEPLLPSDLVKNYLFHRAELDGADARQVQDLYDRHWADFDREASYWRELVRQGRLNTPRVNIFLQNYLTLMKRDEVLAGNLFVEFKRYAEKRTVNEELAALDVYSGIFRSLRNFPTESREAEFFRRLKDLDVTTFHPLLLEVFHRRKELGDDGVFTILRDIESYLVRRSVCRLSTKAYNRMVVDLLAAVVDEFTPQKIRALLVDQTSENTLWPVDSDFKASWATEPLYKGRRARVRMILEALEARARTSKTEQVTFKRQLTVEHLMPQNWKRLWPLPVGVPELQADRRRSSLLHSIGNLALLTQELNSDVSDADWKTRLPEILKYSVLTLNEELRPITQWSEDEIERRALRLFDLATLIWPHPEPTRGTALGVTARGEPLDTVIDPPSVQASEREELLATFAETLGEEVVEDLRSMFTRLETIEGVRVKAGKTFRCRLRLEGHSQRLSLFVLQPEGAWFAWMKTTQLKKLGLDPSFADAFYQQLADTYGVGLRKGVPDGLTIEALVADQDSLEEIVRTFVRDVRAALPAAGESA
jgi:uncharacterized protein with ParB-like and HNH nuclease domain